MIIFSFFLSLSMQRHFIFVVRFPLFNEYDLSSKTGYVAGEGRLCFFIYYIYKLPRYKNAPCWGRYSICDHVCINLGMSIEKCNWANEIVAALQTVTAMNYLSICFFTYTHRYMRLSPCDMWTVLIRWFDGIWLESEWM